MRIQDNLAAICQSVGNRYPDAHLSITDRGITASLKEASPAVFVWPYWAAGVMWQAAVDDLEDWVRKLLHVDPVTPIDAEFVFTGPNGAELQRETRPIHVRISPFRLEFRGGPTGYESYRLQPGLLHDLEDWLRDDGAAGFCICAGTPGSWPSCSVKVGDVLTSIRDAQARGARPRG